jgi:transposase-like protein
MSARRIPVPSDGILRGLSQRYTNGETIESLALDWYVSSTTMRKWLSPYVEFRRGGSRRGYSAGPTKKPPRPTGVHRASFRDPLGRRRHKGFR